jgi:hypothetical protein
VAQQLALIEKDVDYDYYKQDKISRKQKENRDKIENLIQIQLEK